MEITRTALHPYWLSLPMEERKALADRLGTKVSYLKLVALGHKPPSATLAAKLERETGGKVTRADLRPDVFA